MPTLQFFRRVDLLLNVILGTNSSLFILPLENIFIGIFFFVDIVRNEKSLFGLVDLIEKTFHN